MKKKNIIMIILIVIIYSLVFKAWNLLLYTTSNELNEYISEIITSYSKPVKIAIEEKNAKEYIEYNKLKMENIFSKYDKLELEDNKIQYVLYEENEIKKYVSLSKSNDYKTIFINGFEDYSEIDEDSNYEKLTLYEKDKVSKFLNKNKVNNDVSLFNLLLNKHGNVNKLIYKKTTMKENYYIKQYILNVLPRIKKLIVFEGLNGYMFETSGTGYEIHIQDYVIKTVGMSEKEVVELVRTIKINEEK